MAEADNNWTISGTIIAAGSLAIALLAYCKPPASPPSPQPSVPSLAPPSQPKLRPQRLPIDHVWVNSSGPATFQLKSSGAVIAKGSGLGQEVLHVRFTLFSTAKVPAQVWATTERGASYRDVEGWTVDTGNTRCAVTANDFNAIPVANRDQQIIKSNDGGDLFDRAPTVQSRGQLSFSVTYTCDGSINRSAVLFATARVSLGYKNERRLIYFNATDLPIYEDRK